MDKLPDTLKYDIIEETPPEPEPETITETITEQGDILDDIPLEKDVEDELPLFVPKPEPKLEDIFTETKPKRKLTKSGRPRKPMTEEHKQKLALAREKANAKRKYLAEQRKIAKQMEKETKELMKKKKEKEYQKLKKEVEEPVDDETGESNPNFVYEKKEPQKILHFQQTKPSQQEKLPYPGLTKADLEKSHMEAILKVEAMRKQRKAEKKKKQQIDQYNQETMKTLKKLTWSDTAGIYANCF